MLYNQKDCITEQLENVSEKALYIDVRLIGTTTGYNGNDVMLT